MKVNIGGEGGSVLARVSAPGCIAGGRVWRGVDDVLLVRIVVHCGRLVCGVEERERIGVAESASTDGGGGGR